METKNRKFLGILLCAVILLMSLPFTAGGAAQPVELSRTQIFAQNTDAVFMIRSSVGQGSGFFISSHGIGVTAYHVLSNAGSAYIQTNDRETLPIVGYYLLDRENDLAVFQVDGRGRTFSYVTLPPAGRTISIGDRVLTISSPAGGQNFSDHGTIVEIGLVRVYCADRNFDFHIQDALQFTAEIEGGGSGGALFNMFGEVKGVIVSAGTHGGQRTNSAAPISRLPRNIVAGQYSPLPRPNALRMYGTQHTPSGWAQVYVQQGIAAGIVPERFQRSYNQVTTRAEFATLAVNVYETVTGRPITGRVHFNDTNDVNVQKMGYLGVVTGVGYGNFAPLNVITREQAAVMLSRLVAALDAPLPRHSPTFADNAAISNWAFSYVGQMQASGIMGGTGDNLFAPAGQFTMEQSIVTIMRIFNSMPTPSLSAAQVLAGDWSWSRGRYYFNANGWGSRKWDGVFTTFRWSVADNLLVLTLPDDTVERYEIANVNQDDINIGGTLFTRIITTVQASVPRSWSTEQIDFGIRSSHAQLFAEPVVNAIRFTIEYQISEVFRGQPLGRQSIFILSDNEWVNVGSLYAPDNNAVIIEFVFTNPTTFSGVAVVPDVPLSMDGENYSLSLIPRDFVLAR